MAITAAITAMTVAGNPKPSSNPATAIRLVVA